MLFSHVKPLFNNLQQNKMTRLLLLSFFIFLTCITYAQRPPGTYGGGKGKAPSITGKVTGQIIDTLNREAIAFATIVLLKPGETAEVNGNISEDDGKFKLSDVKLGTYDVQVSFIGYKTRMYRNIKLTPKNPDYDFGTIQLLSDNILLDAVEVVEEASVVENRIDKIVYNADKDVTSTGGDAADVLRKVPLLSVDFDGNVSLRGSSNLRILINGKPSGMFSDNVADALKMLPADQIKSVEVITTPSAKYDGEGSGGIINIITKKKSIQGISGNVSASAGNRQNNGVVSLSAAKGRFGINANTSVYYSVPNDATSTFTRTDISDGFTRVLNQDGTNRSSRLGFRGSAGAFYDINAYNSINSNFTMGGRNFNSDGLTTVIFDDPANNFFQEYTRANEGLNGYNSFDWTTDYKRTFPQKDRELSLAFQLNGNNQDNNLTYDQVNIQNAENFEEKGTNDGTNREYTYQIDYTHPFSKAVKLEAGGKSVIRRINSDYDYTVISGLSETPFRSDVFNYNQDVLAGYASFNFNFGENWGLVTGARFEQTDINGDFEVDGNPFENSYNNLLPSIIISRKFKNFQTVKLSYTARIQRPSLFYINPYTNASDRRNTQVGNPLLDPETVDQFDLSYNTFIKGTVVSASIYYKQTSNIIESFLTVDPTGISITSYQNIGENNAIGFNIFSSATIKKKLTIRGSFNYNTYDVTGIANGESVSRQASEFNGNFSGTYDFGKGFKMEGFTFFRSNRQTIQGNIPSFSMYSIGFKKEVWDKRGSIGIRMVEPFTKYKSFTTELSGDNFSLDSVYRLPFRSFGLSFSYRFGKLDFKAKSKRNSKIKNTDLKSGESGNGF